MENHWVTLIRALIDVDLFISMFWENVSSMLDKFFNSSNKKISFSKLLEETNFSPVTPHKSSIKIISKLSTKTWNW